MKNDQLNKKVGINLKKARKEAGLTQVDLANELKMSPMMISRYEVGLNSIPYKHLERIAEILNKPVTYFFDESFNPPKHRLTESIVTQAPKDMLTFSLGKNAKKQEAIKEAKQLMKNWYKENNMQETTKKSFTDWWEGK